MKKQKKADGCTFKDALLAAAFFALVVLVQSLEYAWDIAPLK